MAYVLLLLLITYHLSLITYHLSLITYHLSLITYHLSLITYHAVEAALRRPASARLLRTRQAQHAAYVFRLLQREERARQLVAPARREVWPREAIELGA